MRIALLVALVALVLGGLVGVLVTRDPGYVLVAYEDMAVETSLWFAVLILVAAYFLIRMAAFLLVRLGRGRGRLTDWNRRRRSRAARDQTVRGLLLMAEGRYGDARKLLEHAAPEAQAPIVNYLQAARAAHEVGDTDGRDRLLRSAHQSTAGSRFAVGLTQAELQSDHGQWELALATLLELRRKSPRHPQVLRLLAQCYRQLEDWQALLELESDLRRARVLSDDELAALELDAWRGRLASGREDPVALWKQVPKDRRRHPELVIAFADAQVAAGQTGEAESSLRQALEQNWSDELVTRYGVLQSPDPNRQLVAAEGWLKERPNNPDLLLTLGRISLMNRSWAKAREYLEASLRMKRSAEAQGELGRLCVALGETERGSELLSRALDTLPDLPLPERPVSGTSAPQSSSGA